MRSKSEIDLLAELDKNLKSFNNNETIIKEINALRAQVGYTDGLILYVKTMDLIALMEDSKEVKEGKECGLTQLKKWLHDNQKSLPDFEGIPEFLKDRKFPSKIEWYGNSSASFSNQYDMAIIIKAICDFAVKEQKYPIELTITLPKCPSDKEGDKKEHLEKYLRKAFETAAESGIDPKLIKIKIDDKVYTYESPELKDIVKDLATTVVEKSERRLTR